MPLVWTRWMDNYYVHWIPFCVEEAGHPLVTVATISTGCQNSSERPIHHHVYVGEKWKRTSVCSLVVCTRPHGHSHMQISDKPKQLSASHCEAMFKEAVWSERYSEFHLLGTDSRTVSGKIWWLNSKWYRKFKIMDNRICQINKNCLWKPGDSSG